MSDGCLWQVERTSVLSRRRKRSGHGDVNSHVCLPRLSESNLIRVHSHFLLCSSHIQQFHPHLLFAAMAGPLLLNKNNSGEVYVWPTLRHVVTSSLQPSSALCRRRASSQTIQAQSTLLPHWRCVTLLYSHTHKTNVSLFHLCS